MRLVISRRCIKRGVLTAWGVLVFGLAGVIAVPLHAVAAPSVHSELHYEVTTAELHQLLAPVALYPDSLLSHILIASTYPLDVVRAHRWVSDNSALSGSDAVDAAELEGWHPSVAALVAFPDILERLSIELEWTQMLGDAFLADEERVLDEVQVLRAKAYAIGNLQKMEHVKVVREKRIIYIEPARTDVVYVPYYDTQIIFGPWWWPRHPPHYWHLSHRHRHVNSWGLYWSSGVHIHNHFVFAAPRWHERRVVVGHHRERAKRFNRARQLADWRESQHWRHVSPRREHTIRSHRQVRRTSERGAPPTRVYRTSNKASDASNVRFHNGKPAYRDNRERAASRRDEQKRSVVSGSKRSTDKARERNEVRRELKRRADDSITRTVVPQGDRARPESYPAHRKTRENVDIQKSDISEDRSPRIVPDRGVQPRPSPVRTSEASRARETGEIRETRESKRIEVSTRRDREAYVQQRNSSRVKADRGNHQRRQVETRSDRSSRVRTRDPRASNQR